MSFYQKDKTVNDQINMTPVIDIVFLLIIFFMLVCQYIAAENFEVRVPDEISSGRDDARSDLKQTVTVTVMTDQDGRINYAVASDIIQAAPGSADVANLIAEAIDTQLQDVEPSKRIVVFRNDKEVLFRHSKVALAGISQSSASKVKWAVIREKQQQ